MAHGQSDPGCTLLVLFQPLSATSRDTHTVRAPRLQGQQPTVSTPKSPIPSAGSRLVGSQGSLGLGRNTDSTQRLRCWQLAGCLLLARQSVETSTLSSLSSTVATLDVVSAEPFSLPPTPSRADKHRGFGHLCRCAAVQDESSVADTGVYRCYSGSGTRHSLDSLFWPLKTSTGTLLRLMSRRPQLSVMPSSAQGTRRGRMTQPMHRWKRSLSQNGLGRDWRTENGLDPWISPKTKGT